MTAQILLWDIETSPNLGYVWGMWDQNVVKFHSEWHMLSVAWKWKGSKSVDVAGLDDFPMFANDPEDDQGLARLAQDLFNKADVVVAHNGVAFDTKKAQARMAFHNLFPPSPYREVDTLTQARKHFAFTSNRLDDLCQHLGLGKKAKTNGFETWLGCMNGDPAAWARMKKYNKHDVVLLERLYDRLLPWMTGVPNLATISGEISVCPKCGSDKGMMRRGYAATAVSRRVTYQCKACGGYSRGRATEIVASRYVV